MNKVLEWLIEVVAFVAAVFLISEYPIVIGILVIFSVLSFVIYKLYKAYWSKKMPISFSMLISTAIMMLIAAIYLQYAGTVIDVCILLILAMWLSLSAGKNAVIVAILYSIFCIIYGVYNGTIGFTQFPNESIYIFTLIRLATIAVILKEYKIYKPQEVITDTVISSDHVEDQTVIRLRKLKELLDKDLITKEEFDEKRDSILKEI